MAQVEDVAGTTGDTFEDFGSRGTHGRRVGTQEGRVEIALDRLLRAHPQPRLIEGKAPIDPICGGPYLREELDEMGGARREVDGRHVETGQGLPGRRHRILSKLCRGEEPGPGVEELDHVRPCIDLGLQVGGHRPGQHHQSLGGIAGVEGDAEVGKLLGPPTFDQDMRAGSPALPRSRSSPPRDRGTLGRAQSSRRRGLPGAACSSPNAAICPTV